MSSNSLPTRPTWDDTWLAVAIVVGKRSLCDRAKVGCVVVDGGRRMVASGYNGPPANFPHGDRGCLAWCPRARAATLADTVPARDYADCPSLHAEANALLVGDRRDRDGGTLYTTAHVCIGCAKLISNSGVSRVVVRTGGVAATWRDPIRSYHLMISCGLAVVVDGRPMAAWV